MREDFREAIEEAIADFADEPGISDEEIIEVLEAIASGIRLDIRRREGVSLEMIARALGRTANV